MDLANEMHQIGLAYLVMFGALAIFGFILTLKGN